MDRLLDPKNDWAFKQVFGEEKHKDILLKFLNDALDEHVLHGNLITDVSFLKVNLDTEIIALRQSIVDVLCRAQDGTYFIVEMQRASDSGFIQRAVEYASRVYLNQRDRSQKTKNDKGGYKKLRPVIFLAIMEETLFPHKKAYLSHHQFRDVVSSEHDIKEMSFSFLELSKFHKEFSELNDGIERWAYFFKNAEHIDPEDLDKVLKEDSALSSAYKALERAAYSSEQLLDYERYSWKEEEIQTRIDDARLAGEKAGEEKGRAEERAKAEKELATEREKAEKELATERAKAEKELAKQKAKADAEKVEMAQKMLADGLPIEIISRYSGLSLDEIRALK